jgi:hypothetical protein
LINLIVVLVNSVSTGTGLAGVVRRVETPRLISNNSTLSLLYVKRVPTRTHKTSHIVLRVDSMRDTIGYGSHSHLGTLVGRC